MGYYDNPPIIDMNPGTDQISAGILAASNSIAQGLLKRGERREAAKKEKEITLKKLAAQRNEVDLAYAESVSDWKAKTSTLGKGVDEGVLKTIEQYNKDAADARIALLNESDPSKRKELLGLVTRASEFMQNTSSFTKAFGGESATMRESVNSANFNQAGGYCINGPVDQVEGKNMFLNVMSGMDQTYSDAKIDYQPDGSNFNITISAKDKAGKQLSYTVNSASYLKADGSSTGTFLQKVENVDEFGNNINKSIYDAKSEDLLAPYLSSEKVRAIATDGKQYDGKILNTQEVNRVIKEKSAIKAKGYLMAGNDASIRALVNYTLVKDPHYYDDVFKKIETPEEKEAILTDLFAKTGFEAVTKNLDKTKGKNGEDIYWSPQVEKATVKVPKATKESDSSVTGNSPAKVNNIKYTSNQINDAMQDFARIANEGKGSFTITEYGPKGGVVGAETFTPYKDPKTGKKHIVSEKTGRKFNNSVQLRAYLKKPKL